MVKKNCLSGIIERKTVGRLPYCRTSPSAASCSSSVGSAESSSGPNSIVTMVGSKPYEVTTITGGRVKTSPKGQTTFVLS
jgi:hypothetical protein